MADTGASVVGSLLGTSSMTTYLESATASVPAGAPSDRPDRGGPVPAVPVFPAAVRPSRLRHGTGAVFVAAGFVATRRIEDDLATTVPVMLMAVLMPLTFSIAAGIAIGFRLCGHPDCWTNG